MTALTGEDRIIESCRAIIGAAQELTDAVDADDTDAGPSERVREAFFEMIQSVRTYMVLNVEHYE